MSIRKNKKWGFYGHSTINHNYEVKTINGDKVVIDNATGLMWQQSGNWKAIEWNEALDWLNKFNRHGYAGYYDWRLPTVEEASSLLESGKKNGDLYIAPVFDRLQKRIWTGDICSDGRGSGEAYRVNFKKGSVHRYVFDIFYYVRLVRSSPVK